MKKICHMTSVHTSNDVRIFHKECVSLAKAGYDVTLVAPGESRKEKYINIIGVGERPESRFKRMTSFTKKVYIQSLKLDADIYHFHDPELLPYGLKLKKRNKTVIFDSHEFYSLDILQKTYLAGFLRKIISKAYHIYETYVCKKIDAVISPCSINGIDIFEKRAKKSILIYNTAILSELYDKYDAEYKKKERTICYIGVLTKDRGITQSIKAAYKSGAFLTLGGKFDPQNYYDEVGLLKEYSCVDYRGFVSRDNICEILNESIAGICVLLNVGQYNIIDNFGTKVYEYMSMGLPAIIADTSYARKVNNKYNCFILVSPDSVDEISNAINYILKNPEEAKRMGENGRRAIAEEFNWGIEEKKLLELYQIL